MTQSRRFNHQSGNKRRGFQALAILFLSAASLATNGFGVFPDNRLSQAFREIAGEAFPAEFLSPINQYFQLISAPTIEPVSREAPDVPPDLIGIVENLLLQKTPQQPAGQTRPLDQLMTDISKDQTAIAQTQTAMPTSTKTPTATSTFTPLPPTFTATASPSATTTPAIIRQLWIPSKVVKKEPDLPTFTPTATPIPYMIFYQGGFTDALISTRANADSFCTSGLPAGYANYRAVISMNSTDSIASMPANYGIPTGTPIRDSTGGILIGNNWADLLDGSIITSLQTAGVISTTWWSGSEGDGTNTVATNDCNDWTTNSIFGPPMGVSGVITVATSGWLNGNPTAACNNVLPLLCVAY